MNIYGYVRVSSTDQNENRQMIALRKAAVPERGAVFPNALPLVQDRGHHQPGRRECAYPGVQLHA